MLDVELRFEDGTMQRQSLALPIEIGRAPDCGLRIKAWRVARRHARIDLREAGAIVMDFGSLYGTLLNGQRVTEYGPLRPGDEIVIGPCLIHVLETPLCPAPPPSYGLAQSSSREQGDGLLLLQNPLLDTLRSQETPHDKGASSHNSSDPAPLSAPDAVQAFAASPGNGNADQAAAGLSPQSLLQHRRRLHCALLDALDLRRRDIAAMSDQALRSEAQAVLADILSRDQALPQAVNRDELLREVVNEAVGLGPLEPLLADPAISEIMVNRYNEIFIESAGKLTRHYSIFSGEQAVLGVIERIVSPLGRRIDESSPMVDARLRDGSRVNAVIPPIALRGASLTIRKFPRQRPSMSDLLRMGTLDKPMSRFLQVCVAQRKNILVSGGTGSGKTTLLNILSNCIPAGERIVTIEDAAELRLNHEHLVALEARPANLEGCGKIEIRDLVRNALRMRPDRIVIGECRGGEAFDMLAAMNTGHEGSLTTLHANTPRDALSRLETMILMAGMDLPLSAVREHIAASINLIVQQARLSDGRRLITSVVEVTGMESGRIQTQELFRYLSSPPRAFIGCGVIPEFFSDEGVRPNEVNADLFNQRTLLDPSAGNGSFISSVQLPHDSSGTISLGRG